MANCPLLDPEECRILIADASGGVRVAVKEVLTELGFSEMHQFATIQEAMPVINKGQVDWMIASVQASSDLNVFQLIRDLLTKPGADRIYFTLLIERDEEEHLLTAFEMGILSWLQKPVTKEGLEKSLTKLIKRVEKYEEPALVSAFEVRTLLKKTNRFEDLIGLERSLFQLFRRSDLLLNRAHAQLMAGHENEALMLLHDVQMIDPSTQDRVAALIREYTDNDDIEELVQLGFNLDHVIIVDTDETVVTALRDIGSALGAQNIEHFTTARDALEWVEENKKWLNDSNQLHLVLTEWKLPDMSGHVFVQHLRVSGLIRPPIVVCSSLVSRADESILTEVGVGGVLSKPINRQEVLTSLIGVMRMDINPMTKSNKERKIRLLLQNKDIEEANRFLVEYCNDSEIADGDKIKMRAEFSFAEGNLEKCKTELMQGIRMAGIDAVSINLLGKCLMQLQDYSNAAKCFSRAEGLSPQNIDRMCNIAISEVNNGRADVAEKALSEVQALGVDERLVAETQAKMAITQGQSLDSTDIWEDEAATSNIAAFINNQAVVYARSGRVSASIETYRKALETIPKGKHDMRFTISYNLGLAHVRNEILENAVQPLTECAQKDNPNESLRKKAANLLGRVNQCINSGRKLSIASGDGDSSEVSLGNDADMAELEMFVEPPHILPGELCLFGIFRSSVSIPKETRKLLAAKE